MTLPDTPAAPVAPTPDTGRVQLALDVDDLDEAVTFYSALLGAPPAKLRPGYANFAVASPPLKLVLLENPGRGGSLNHLGVEVPSTDQVRSEIARLSGEGLLTDEEMGSTCCFATQDKVWVTGPGGERWEIYTVLADSAAFGAGPQTLLDAAQPAAGEVCCGTGASGTDPATGAAVPSACC